jgi:hypothetical protein
MILAALLVKLFGATVIAVTIIAFAEAENTETSVARGEADRWRLEHRQVSSGSLEQAIGSQRTRKATGFRTRFERDFS